MEKIRAAPHPATPIPAPSSPDTLESLPFPPCVPLWAGGARRSGECLAGSRDALLTQESAASPGVSPAGAERATPCGGLTVQTGLHMLHLVEERRLKSTVAPTTAGKQLRTFFFLSPIHPVHPHVRPGQNHGAHTADK